MQAGWRSSAGVMPVGLIGLTDPNRMELSVEVRQTQALLDGGLSLMHLRKPAAGLEEMSRWIRLLSPGYKAKLVWHLPRSLQAPGRENDRHRTSISGDVWRQIENFASEHAITRIHLPAWFRAGAGQQRNWHRHLPPGLCYSTSVHSIEELQELQRLQAFADADGLGPEPASFFDYALISPVFDSLSKKGYKASAGLLQQVADYVSTAHQRRQGRIKVVALGGICAGNIDRVHAAGFDGAALMGSLWQAASTTEQTLIHLQGCKRKLDT